MELDSPGWLMPASPSLGKVSEDKPADTLEHQATSEALKA